MKKNNLQKNIGFSLIEMIIYIAIFSVFILSLFAFSNIIINGRLHNQIVLEVNEQGTQVIRTITQSIRNAKSVNSPNAGGSASTLSLQTYNGTTDQTIFSETGGVLQIEEGAGSPSDLTNNKVKITNLSFANLSTSGKPGSIKIRFTMENSSANPSSKYSKDFYGSASIR